jgi:hypothetical protein
VDEELKRELRRTQFLLADILNELQKIRNLLDDDDGEEEKEEGTADRLGGAAPPRSIG